MGYALEEVLPELPHNLRRDLVLCLHNKEEVHTMWRVFCTVQLTLRSIQVELTVGHSMDYEFTAELQLLMRHAIAEKNEMICRIGELAQA